MSRRSARLALLNPVRLDPVAVLFPELISAIFAQLPVDSRLRCREVCRGWLTFLADTRHWQVLDLSLTSGVAHRTRTLALLRAASERAQGTLRELDVSGWYTESVGEKEDVLEEEQLLLVLCASNAASLLELRAWQPIKSEEGTICEAVDIEEMLVAAPRLRLLECDVLLDGEEAEGPLPRLLREPQFAPLRLLNLEIDADDVQPPPDVPALALWAAKHASLKSLCLVHFQLDSEPALDPVAELVISQLQRVDLVVCSLSPASLPALTRMLKSRSLIDLRIENDGAPLLMGAVVPAFCAAMWASRLDLLTLRDICLWESHADGLAVIAACTSHPTLRTINFRGNGLQSAPDRAAIDAALDLLEASIPELRLRR